MACCLSLARRSASPLNQTLLANAPKHANATIAPVKNGLAKIDRVTIALAKATNVMAVDRASEIAIAATMDVDPRAEAPKVVAPKVVVPVVVKMVRAPA